MLRQKNIFLLLVVLAFPLAGKANKDYALHADQEKNWKAFSLKDIIETRRKNNRPYHRFINESSMSMGLYELKAGAVDGQNPHAQDEVYYIVKGKAILKMGSDDYPVKAGSIVFVKANIAHKFYDIKEDLQVLVIFPKTAPDAAAKDWLAFEMDDIIKKRDAQKNIWNQFLQVPTMRFGLYMLPEALGGDNTLTHKVDEVNIVVNGKGKFKMGDDEISVEPGSIVYVKDSIGHSFHSLEGDFDVLILFEVRK